MYIYKKMALTGSYEYDKNVLLKVDREDFKNTCSIDKYSRDLCNNKKIIQERVIKEYDVDYVTKYRIDGISLLRQYISLTEIMDEAIYNIKQSDPEGFGDIEANINYIIKQGRKDVILTYRHIFNKWYDLEPNTLLYAAIDQDKIDIINVLFKEDDEAAKTANDGDIIDMVIDKEDIRIFKILVKYGMDINNWPEEYYQRVLSTHNDKFIRQVKEILDRLRRY